MQVYTCAVGRSLDIEKGIRTYDFIVIGNNVFSAVDLDEVVSCDLHVPGLPLSLNNRYLCKYTHDI